MRAIEISKFGSPDVLQLCQRPIPTLQQGEVLIKVHAAGINRPDVLQRLGKYPVPQGASDLPGLEIAGEIIDGDLKNSPFKLGDAVCALIQGGGYAEYCAAPLSLCLPVPKNLNMLEAASLPETFFTVWSNVFDRAQIQTGESLLVHGGTSGIGVAATQIAHALGHTVYTTVGSDEKRTRSEQLGATRAINYKTEDFVSIIQELTHQQGVNVILDMIAGSYLPRNIQCLADDGRIAIIALQDGKKANLDLIPILTRRLHITGSTLRARSTEFKTKIAQQLQTHIWPFLEQQKIKPVIHQIFPLEHAAAAHALMETNQHIGKIMLTLHS